MPLFRMKHRSQVTVQLFCLVLLNGLLHVQHLYPNRLFPTVLRLIRRETFKNLSSLMD